MLGVGNYEWHDYFSYKFISEFNNYQSFHSRHELCVNRYANGQYEMFFNELKIVFKYPYYM